MEYIFEENNERSVSIFDNEPIDEIITSVFNGENAVNPDVQNLVRENDVRNEGTIVTSSGLIDQIRQVHQIGQTNDAVVTDSLLTTVDTITPIAIENDTDENEEQTATAEDQPSNIINNIEESFNLANENQIENEMRFSGAEWFDRVKNMDIIMAGVGGIGSWASVLLSRVHPNSMSLFDDDVVDFSNLAGQLYSMNNITQYKCSACASNISLLSNYNNVNVFNEKYTGKKHGDIMICGFDNMKARRIFFSEWKQYVNSIDENKRKNTLFIDGRLGMEELQIFTIRGDEPNNMKRYEKEYLFDDSEAEQVPCSMKQTSFMAAMIGSMITNLFVNFATNIGEEIDVRPIPFLTLYDANNMNMKLIF